LSGSLSYATSLFDRGTVARYLGYWVTWLRGMVSDESRKTKASDLSILDSAERDLVLVEWNDTAQDYPRHACVHQLFEEQVRRTPEATALACGDQRVSYVELNARANRLAHHLLALGVKPDDRVAICVERSVEMVVGLLGILKAGGAYVPLDPAYPVDRLSYMLSDSAPVALLTQGALHERLSDLSTTSVAVVALDEDSVAAEAMHDPVVEGLTSRNLAYVIYTSGSTGQPKGVAIEHVNTGNLIAWAQANFAAEELGRTLFSTSINFDLAVFELFAPLSSGATVVLARDVLAVAPATEVSLINTVPSAITSLIDAEQVPRSARIVNLAGEPLKRALTERIFASTQAGAVANLYGPTETTTYSTWVRMDRSGGFLGHIGRPIANTQVYILDTKRRPVPQGVIGEIHIGGDGVARGYLHRPELTAERFLDDPFSGEAGARMYKTGDLGRWLPDGNIEYLGRNDFQVKVRGFRIELGEIEAKLLGCEGIREAVVLAREDAVGEKRLVAYVTLATEQSAEHTPEHTAQWRTQLLSQLPDYMVPGAFVVLEALPLTLNGKLDRKSLPAPDDTSYARRAYEAPQGDVEEALAAIWSELLRVERVGRNDNFFELGGHSLLAVRIMAKTKDGFGRLVPLAALFSAPTIREFAQLISDHDDRGSDIAVKIQPAGERLPIFAVPGAGGNVLSFRALSEALGPDQPFFGLQAVGLDGRTPPLETVEATATANVAAIRTIQPQGPYRLIGHSYGGVVAYEMARLLMEQGEDVADLVLLDAIAPRVMQTLNSFDKSKEAEDLCAAISELGGARLKISGDELRGLTVDVLAGVLAANGFEIGKEQLEILYRVFNANMRCYEGFRPASLPWNINVRLYRATDHGAPDQDTEWRQDYGWGELLLEPPLIFDLGANHFSMLHDPSVRVLAEELRRTAIVS
ncbi:MAG: amino acid adenylation domain-containing protein, partial [Lysobacteraceae bacterium]